MIFLSRIHALVRKEFQSLLSTKSGRLLLIMPVILQTALFPFAATLEVKNASLAVFNEDHGRASVEMMQRFAASGAFSRVIPVWSGGQVDEAIGTRQALLAVHIPADFSRKVSAGETSPVQVILDGRRSNSSQIAFNYLQSVLDEYLKDRAAAAGRVVPCEIVVRNGFVPNLEYTYFILSSLVAIITTIGSLIVTALSVAREREQGTFEQLLVSPLSPEMIMIGKAVPAVVVGFFQATLILIAAVYIYHVPFRGNLALLYGAMFFYALALVGWVVAYFAAQWLAPQWAPHLPLGEPGSSMNYAASFAVAFMVSCEAMKPYSTVISARLKPTESMVSRLRTLLRRILRQM